MTKRILSLILAGALCVGLLAGCGSKNNADTQPSDAPSNSQPVEQDPAVSIDLQAFYDKMMNAAVEPPMLMNVAEMPEMLDGFYPGLSTIDTKQCLVFMPAMTGQAIEFAFVEVANAADVKAVKDILQARIDSVVNAEMNYPTTLEVWQTKSEIVEMGNYVCLFVHADKDVLVKAFREGTDVPEWCVPEIIDDEANYEDEVAEGDDTLGTVGGDTVIEFPVEKEEPADGSSSFTGGSVENLPATGDSEATVKPLDPPAAQPSTAPEVNTPSQDPATSTSIDLATFYDKMMNAAVEPPFMMALEGEYLDNFYAGLSAIDTKQCVVMMPAMTGQAIEFAFVEVADTADIDAVKAILQARIDSVLNALMVYPTTLDAWENHAEIVTIGNCVCLFVHTDKDMLISALKSGSAVSEWCKPEVIDDEAAYADEL